jgi:MoaA/NifB/PqqE/SkfB family radical SAM enzyme
MKTKLTELGANGSFCILPFIHQEKKFNGTYHVCCYGDQLQSDNPADESLASFNSDKINRIRSDMLSGTKPADCNSCYQQEHNNIYSPRLRENHTWTNWESTHTAVEKCFDDFTHKNTIKPISYDLRYSNTCTLKCRMCNSSSSSALNAEYKKIQHQWPEKFWTIDNPRINHEVELHSDVQKIYLAGGEPLVEPLNLELLDKVAHHNPNLVILINTSLNHLSEKFVTVLNKFKYLTLVVSIDGTHQINDYVRNGSNFDTVIKNIRSMAHHDMIFSTCVSIYNVFNVKQLVTFINKEFPNSGHGIHLVNDIPEVFVDNVPPELRPGLIQQLETCLLEISDFSAQGIHNIITTLKQNNFDHNRFNDFIKYTKILDESRGESIINMVPELAKYFNEQS